MHSNIVIGAGFSGNCDASIVRPVYYDVIHAGHGFKLSPVIGKILSELALGLPPSYDLSLFKLSRFV